MWLTAVFGDFLRYLRFERCSSTIGVNYTGQCLDIFLMRGPLGRSRVEQRGSLMARAIDVTFATWARAVQYRPHTHETAMPVRSWADR